METINPSKLKKLIGIHYKTKTPLMIYGGFGIGKSTIVKATAEELAKTKNKEFVEWNKTDKETKLKMLDKPEDYFVLIDERLSQYDLGDLRLPSFADNKEFVEWKLPLWLVYLLKPNADGVLFFDELNLATPSVLASCYQIIHDREINGEKLNDNVLIVSAGNRTQDKGNTYDMPLPLRDRKSEYELVVDLDEWLSWGLKNNINKDILAFLKFRGDYLLKIETDKQNKSITPRGWERTSKLIDDVKDTELTRSLISGSIGNGVSNEFLAFIKLKNELDIDDIIKNPKKVKDIDGIDLKCSLISGLANKYEQDKKLLPNLIKVCSELDAEFSVLLLKFLLSIYPKETSKNILKSNEMKDIIKEYGKYLIDYGED